MLIVFSKCRSWATLFMLLYFYLMSEWVSNISHGVLFSADAGAGYFHPKLLFFQRMKNEWFTQNYIIADCPRHTYINISVRDRKALKPVLQEEAEIKRRAARNPLQYVFLLYFQPISLLSKTCAAANCSNLTCTMCSWIPQLYDVLPEESSDATSCPHIMDELHIIFYLNTSWPIS